MAPEHLLPSRNHYEDALGEIYVARSKNVHVAVPFPAGTGIGINPWINVRDLPLEPDGQPEIPPVTWFERVVSIAVRRYLMPAGPMPFIE
jgi:hypothetical protein